MNTILRLALTIAVSTLATAAFAQNQKPATVRLTPGSSVTVGNQVVTCESARQAPREISCQGVCYFYNQVGGARWRANVYGSGSTKSEAMHSMSISCIGVLESAMCDD